MILLIVINLIVAIAFGVIGSILMGDTDVVNYKERRYYPAIFCLIVCCTCMINSATAIILWSLR
jgi:hypothetical protein